MQGLLLVWRGCLFAGLCWMCTDYEAGSLSYKKLSEITGPAQPRDKPVYAEFISDSQVCHGGYSSLCLQIWGMQPLIQQPRFWPFFSPLFLFFFLFETLSFPSYTLPSFPLSHLSHSHYLFPSNIPNLSI